MSRDYWTISPSARQLLLVKAHTSLPFARSAAELVFGAGAVAEAASGDPGRRRHFELRTRSLDVALDAHGATRVLELAAGLSFRGLALAATRRDIHYVDTDLPEMAALKAELVPQLHPGSLAGTLEVAPLDALDPAAFAAAARSLPPGPLAIVHEGLLVYLDDDEKARLAANIRAALCERGAGSAWITADIYVRSEHHLYREPHVQRFLDAHKVDERKFADFAAAAAFVLEHGFAITRREDPSDDPWRVRETWTLTPL
jgi:O-methyltransferase involved in polyketide biosynthesis